MAIIRFPAPINIVTFQVVDMAPWWTKTLSEFGTTLFGTEQIMDRTLFAAMFGTRGATPILRRSTVSGEHENESYRSLKRFLKQLKALNLGHKIREIGMCVWAI